MPKVTAIVLLCFCALSACAEDRFWIAAKVNGTSALFIFDTGASVSCLSDTESRRLGLTNLPGLGTTKDCDLSVGNAQCRTWFFVLDLPVFASLKCDGLLGWPTLKNNILQLDAETGRLTPLKKLPWNIASWTKVPMRADYPVLALLAGTTRPMDTVLIDTGNEEGIELPPKKWGAWRQNNANQPLTVSTAFNPQYGMATTLESWADRFQLGVIRLTQSPVAEAAAWDLAIATNLATASSHFVGTLGMAALKRLDFIIDGPKNIVYLRPKKTAARPVYHNRLALGFAPRNPQSDQLFARVVEGGPAYQAGIRDGDILLKVGDQDMTHWRDITIPGEKEEPPGTKRSFTLARGSNTFTTTVISRDIIGPPFDPSRQARWITNHFLHSSVSLSLIPYSADDYVERGVNLEALGDFDCAIADFTEGIRLCPTNADAYLQRGVAYEDKKDATNAISDLTAAVRLAPKNAAACDYLGYTYAEAGNYKRAIEFEQHALAMGNYEEKERRNIKERITYYETQMKPKTPE